MWNVHGLHTVTERSDAIAGECERRLKTLVSDRQEQTEQKRTQQAFAAHGINPNVITEFVSELLGAIVLNCGELHTYATFSSIFCILGINHRIFGT